MKKGLDTFIKLDDWTDTRFASEMEAIRELLLVIKEAIEAEEKLPNHLELSGDKFKVNFELLTVPLDPVVRPESPVEKPCEFLNCLILIAFYSFTCLQLLNFARQFREIAPSGILSSKEFTDSITRFSNLSVGTAWVPEMLATADAQTVQQICAILDPFETGFVSWRKYLYIQSRSLPVPSVEYLVNLKAVFQSCPSYRDGKVRWIT